MSAADDYALQTSIDELDTLVAKIRSIPDLATRKKEEKIARAKLAEVKSKAQSFTTAIQSKLDASSRLQFNARSKQLDEKLKGIDQELRSLTASTSSSTAASSGATSSKKKKTFDDDEHERIMGEGGKDGEGFQNAKQVMQATNRAQDSINKSLTRSLQMGQTLQTQTNEMCTALGVGKK